MTRQGIKSLRADVEEARNPKVQQIIEIRVQKEEAAQQSIVNFIRIKPCNKQLAYDCSNYSEMTRRKDPP